MKTPKKRNKKYNPKMAAARASEHLLKHHAVVYLCSLDRVVLMDTRNKTQVIPSGTVARAITDIPHQWAVDCAVLCRDQFGVEYIVNQQVATKNRYYHADLIDALNEEHWLLIKECNPQHILNYGWFATLNDVEIPQARQEEIYRMLEGFECLTKPEAEAEGICTATN